MKVEELDSDRVLYLVWRFLLESDFRETAAKLQREWQVEHPHREFRWARHVETRALVILLRQGMQHQALLRECVDPIEPNDAEIPVPYKKPLMGVFGPLVTEELPSFEDLNLGPHQDQERGQEEEVVVEEVMVEEQEEIRDEFEENYYYLDPNDDNPVRKRAADPQCDSPSKRQRLSDETESYTTTAADDLPLNSISHPAYPSPLDVEQPTTPITRTDGPAVSAQKTAVRDLRPYTTNIDIQPRESSVATGENSTSEIMHCSWNPHNPDFLAAGGSNTFAQVWTIGDNPLDLPPSCLLRPTPVNGVVSMTPPPAHSQVTAMAWNHAGSHIVTATLVNSHSIATVFDPKGNLICDWDLGDSPVLSLKWNPSDSRILTIIPHLDGVTLQIFRLMYGSMGSTMCYELSVGKQAEPPDAAWRSDDEVVVCAAHKIFVLSCKDDTIRTAQLFKTQTDDKFYQVRCDPILKITVTTDTSGQLDIWSRDGERQTLKAHEGLPVTTVALQPSVINRDFSHANGIASKETLLAAASEAGVISLWKVGASGSTPDPYMVMRAGWPIAALAITPNGTSIAAATFHGIVVFKIGAGDAPYANLPKQPPLLQAQPQSQPVWLSPKTARSSVSQEVPASEDVHLLSWNAASRKLAYGVGGQLVVIHVPNSFSGEETEQN